MEGGLTFTIGKGFGQMLQRIAWERLTEKLSPKPRSTNSIVTGKHVARECYFSGPRKNQ